MERDEINTVYFNCDAENPVDAFKEFLRERLQPGVDSQEEDCLLYTSPSPRDG